MTRRVVGFAVVTAAAVLMAAGPASGQTFNSGSDNSDGDYTFPPGITTIDLNTRSSTFQYANLTIPSGSTVKFIRNQTNSPVTILASGNVTIAGVIDISGANGTGESQYTDLMPRVGGKGGVGGFDGGWGSNASIPSPQCGSPAGDGGAGLGPGGGAAGSWCTSPGGRGGQFANLGYGGYGQPGLLPLIGGSGGGGGSAVFGKTGASGGGGGGAILIAASGTISVTGSILAVGGAGGGNCYCPAEAGAGGGGSGGGIRLVATTIAGAGGTLNVAGGAAGPGWWKGGEGGGSGRIRLEAFTNNLSGTFSAYPSLDTPSVVALANTPALRIISVAGQTAPAQVSASLTNPDITLPAGTPSSVVIVVEGTNIPANTAVVLTVKGAVGPASTFTTPGLTGTPLRASTSVTIPTSAPAVISASATFVRTAALGDGPVFVEGEPAEFIRVVATPGGRSGIALVTASGKEAWLP
jgi:hypothetical protein